jgi:hypothetical protein
MQFPLRNLPLMGVPLFHPIFFIYRNRFLPLTLACSILGSILTTNVSLLLPSSITFNPFFLPVQVSHHGIHHKLNSQLNTSLFFSKTNSKSIFHPITSPSCSISGVHQQLICPGCNTCSIFICPLNLFL